MAKPKPKPKIDIEFERVDTSVSCIPKVDLTYENQDLGVPDMENSSNISPEPFYFTDKHYPQRILWMWNKNDFMNVK